MPFALVLIGLILLVSGARNTYSQLGAQLTKDFTGQGNFTYWLVALAVLGAIGSVPALKKFSHSLLALTIISMILRNGGFFDKITAYLKSGPVAPQASAGTTANQSASNDNSTATNVASNLALAALI